VREPAARRLSLIPPYLFQELDELRSSTRGDVIDLGEGSPDRPTPAPIIAAFRRALNDTENHRYPSYPGKLSCRESSARWYRRRFGVKLDPAKEVSMLVGSKEGVAHLLWGVCGPGDVIAYGDPGYPVYQNQARLCGAKPLVVPLLAKNGFLPDLGWLEQHARRIKLLCLNYPGNPTAAVADSAFYRAVVGLALKHGFYVANDCVYSELYFGARPPSILEVPGARECCVEFHSLSKTFNMAGWRVGMVAGNAGLIRAMLRIKQNTDSGPFGAIQDAAAWALDHAGRFAAANRRLYRRRRDVFCSELARHCWQIQVPEATFYVWSRVPQVQGPESKVQGLSDDFRFVLAMLKACKVVAAPGSGFGRHGRGYVRFALVAPEQRLREAARRVGMWLESQGCRL
jgi:LL-diaminopimelate aminotransferase